MSRNEALFQEASTCFPGGVNSPVRAFRSVGGNPRFMARGKGSRLSDVDGKEYIDYVLSWGPLILGHAHPKVVAAVAAAAAQGMSFGAPTEQENRLAIAIKRFFPSLELLRFVNSGTEACMGAIRVARAATKRDNIIKFSGCYHGHADYLLVSAGSGVSTLGLPDSPGVPASFTSHTFVAPYNDAQAVETILKGNKGTVAAIIVEPVAGNMGFMRPRPGFLETLRSLCDEHGTVLIFDEVMTGFRIAPGGAQEYFGIRPDLSCLGKVVGGGMPVGVYGGRRDIMSMVAPSGPVYQAGTLSGNPVAMAAGLATLEVLEQEDAFGKARNYQEHLVAGLQELGKKKNADWTVDGLGTMFGLRFLSGAAYSYEDLKAGDTLRFGRFFRKALESGIYFAPSSFEAGFTSSTHTDDDLELTLKAVALALDA
ncbi:MAG: glutamate-1-semialdehyde 2,1-aminomutase [Spirochaetia bacterium]|nr:glutamate-1-semialdehyde 2,1-aminomutase [Spirochaetia bacterium]